MDFDHSPKVKELQARVQHFMDRHVQPSEQRYQQELRANGQWQTPPVLEDLKAQAKLEGLWNARSVAMCR